MKFPLILTIGVCLLFAAVPATADQAADEAAIRKAEQQFVAAWNAHDPKAVMATVDEHSEDWEGTIKGRAAIEKAFEEYFAGLFKNIKVKLIDEIGIVFVTPDVAIYKARYHSSGALDEAGNEAPAQNILYARIYLKRNGKWLGAHGMFTRPVEE